LHVPEGIPAMHILERFRTTALHVAFVFDEYGDFQGLVTLTDVMSAIAGQLPEEHRPTAQEILKREDGTWLVDGRTPIDEVQLTFGMDEVRGDGDFETVAGFLVHELKKTPEEGDIAEAHGFRFEVIDMDGRRIDKILVTRIVEDDVSI
jgi:putative hemolysin